MTKKTLTLTLVLALPASLTLAERPGRGGPPPGPPPNQQREDEPRGGTAQKREREREPREKPPLPPPPLLKALDADDDGIIAAGEIEKAPDALKSLDKNEDGKLTPNEFLAPRPDAPPKRETAEKEREWPFPSKKPPGDREKKPEDDRNGERPHPKIPPPLVVALDADRDREISADEIADSAKALLTLDKNGDGQLGPREFLGPHHGPRPDGDGPKPPRPPEEAE